MARPTDFGAGFDPSEFGGKGSAQLVIQTGAHTTYQDGDILCAFNKRRIRHVHLDNICNIRHQGFTGNGLRALGSIAEDMQRETYQYKFERISATEVRRTDLVTLEELVFGPVPQIINGKSKTMDVERYLARRVVHPLHRIFGTPGAEIWYGGRTRGAWDNLGRVWDAIEAKTALREINHLDHPLPPPTFKQHLVISTNDFDDATSADLVEPLRDETDEENIVIVAKRKRWVTWRSLPDVVEANVLNKQLRVDIRGRRHIHQSVANLRTI